MIDINEKEELAALLPEVVTLARAAGQVVMEIYGELNPAVEYKSDHSPLTQADLVSHHTIEKGLLRLAPYWPVLSEESKEIPFEQRKSWEYFWLVDPIDGTKEFLKRSGEFTINIALMERSAPILGVVFAPVFDKLYYGARGAGCWLADRGQVSQIRTARSGNGKTRVVVSRSHGSSEEDIGRFTGDAANCEFVSMGSSLKFCLVAEGVADVYPRIGPTMEWDTAAAQCLVEEAGGTVTDLEGNPMYYNKPNLLNPGFIAKGRR